MAPTRRPAGFTLGELMLVVACAVLVVAVTVPALARTGTISGVEVSLGNLATLGAAHAIYAGDFNGRQFTAIADDISTYGDTPTTAFAEFALQNGGCGEPCWHPPLILGWTYAGSGKSIFLFRFLQAPGLTTNHGVIAPISFSGPARFLGAFRLPNARPLHDYVGGRFYDPVFYAPNDAIVFPAVEPGFASPWEYVVSLFPPIPLGPVPGWSSYCLSPAAMFHPDVMRAPPDGGWQNPWLLDHGFESPGLFQAAYPALKTQILEHHWNQNPPADLCNPTFSYSVYPCEPYYFNHGFASAPATLFYDLSTRLLPNREVEAADAAMLERSGYGLWSRDTPFSIYGYFQKNLPEDIALSHHVLTTRGILGRDTITTPARRQAK